MGGLIVDFGLVVWLFGFIADLVFTTYWLHLIGCIAVGWILIVLV